MTSFIHDYLGQAQDEAERLISENKRLRTQLANLAATEADIDLAETIVDLREQLRNRDDDYDFLMKLKNMPRPGRREYVMQTEDEEIIWGQKGAVITAFMVDGDTDELFSDFCGALGEAVNEVYCNTTDIHIREVQYVNDVGVTHFKEVREWRVRMDVDGDKMTFSVDCTKSQ